MNETHVWWTYFVSDLFKALVKLFGFSCDKFPCKSDGFSESTSKKANNASPEMKILTKVMCTTIESKCAFSVCHE